MGIWRCNYELVSTASENTFCVINTESQAVSSASLVCFIVQLPVTNLPPSPKSCQQSMAAPSGMAPLQQQWSSWVAKYQNTLLIWTCSQEVSFSASVVMVAGKKNIISSCQVFSCWDWTQRFSWECCCLDFCGYSDTSTVGEDFKPFLSAGPETMQRCCISKLMTQMLY